MNKILTINGSSKNKLLRLMNFMFNNSIYYFRRILGNKTAVELRMNYKDGYYYQGDSTEVVLSDCKKVKKLMIAFIKYRAVNRNINKLFYTFW